MAAAVDRSVRLQAQRLPPRPPRHPPVTPAVAPACYTPDNSPPYRGEVSSPRLLLRARRTFVDGTLRPAGVLVEDGTITDVVELDDAIATSDPASGLDLVTLPDDEVLLPGLVDSHVHVNEPGRTQWEGFASATLAAAAGGVTTLVDMPLNSIPPTTTAQALQVKRAAAAPSAHVDVAFWGGAVPENLGSLAPLHEAGVRGFKCFLAPSGVPEFGHLDHAGLQAAAAEVATLGSRLIVHAEDPDLLGPAGPLGPTYGAFLASRPPASERSAIEAVIAVARRTGARVHVLHLSDAGSLPLIRAAKADGVALTVETCPHYLTLDAGHVPDGDAAFKCCPPIREAANQNLLWEGVLDGTIDAVVTDHSPSTPDLKATPDLGLAWGGISGLQVGLSATWTEARRRGVALERLLPLLTTGPAAVAGLTDLPGLSGLGRIAVGAPAHLVAFAPDDAVHVTTAALAHRNPVSAYDGADLLGRVRRTWLRGELVHDVAASDPGDPPRPLRSPSGRLLGGAA